jgi:hypothetical protein
MRGNLIFYRPDPNSNVSQTWEGRRVSFNGSDRTATVVRAYWQGVGKGVQLYVSETGRASDAFLTDSEHVTIVKEA